ncbi:MAG: hypothetical protein JXX28_16550 [Deltaproteobacteria bacterium]|nr:hypothetical protein [Deltaproteobacteria bacterium]
MRGLILFSVLVGCGADVETQTQDLSVAADTPPQLTLERVDEVEFGVVSLSGTLRDAEQPESTLLVELSSSLNGALWMGNGGSDGTWSWEGTLSAGTHALSLSVRDASHNEQVLEEEIWVHGVNEAPRCEILSPAEGSVFAAREEVPFSALVEDPNDDPVLLLWHSSLSGGLFMGEEMTMILPVGVHEIQVVGDDQLGGQCEATVLIQVGG